MKRMTGLLMSQEKDESGDRACINTTQPKKVIMSEIKEVTLTDLKPEIASPEQPTVPLASNEGQAEITETVDESNLGERENSGQTTDDKQQTPPAESNQNQIYPEIFPDVEAKKNEIRMMSLHVLRAHPIQNRIYGEHVPDQGMVESITTDGIKQPIIANQLGFILSGHTRWKAAKIAKKRRIPVIVIRTNGRMDEVENLIISNRQRVKNPEQVAREAFMLMSFEKKKSKTRQLEPLQKKRGVVQSEPTEQTEFGEASVTVGKKLGIGATKVKQAVRVIEVLDDLNNNNETEKVNQLKGYLDKSINYAAANLYKLTLKVENSSVSPESTIPQISDSPTKGEIISDLWESLTMGMSKWDEEKISRFKSDVLGFLQEWENKDEAQMKEAE